MSKANEASSFTGRRRRKKTSWSVRMGDEISRRVITIGGVGTILTVSLVFAFLAFVVFPLFSTATVSPRGQATVAWPVDGIMHVEIDEYQAIGWSLYRTGELRVFRADTGEMIHQLQAFEGKTATSLSTTTDGDDLAIGFDDGTVQFGRIYFQTDYQELGETPEEFSRLSPGEIAVWDQAIVQLTPQRQVRRQAIATEFQPALKVAEGPVEYLDHVVRGDENQPLAATEYGLACWASGQFKVGTAKESTNDFTGETTLAAELKELPTPPRQADVAAVLMLGRGFDVLLAYRDGHMVRAANRGSQSRIQEELDVLDAGQLTAIDLILGRETVLVADDAGGMNAWFLVRHDRARAEDGFELQLVHRLQAASRPATAIAASQRSRLVAVGYEDGQVRVFHVTTSQLIASLQLAGGGAVDHVYVAPKDNGLLALTQNSLWQADFDPAHPEATWASLFRPVWYEGYDSPQNIWQSSFATSGPEMKLGLIKLIFGTIKATFYSMLFGAPLALLAAIYTSEFMQPRTRARVKPIIEMMASLPSVVLGFLAALVFAPFVESCVPATLCCIATVPAAYVFGAWLWMLVPAPVARQFPRLRAWALALTLPLGLAIGIVLGPICERVFFAGDVMLWLDGQRGSGVAAWLMLLLPLTACAIALTFGQVVNDQLKRRYGEMSRPQFALVNLVKSLAMLALVLLGAWVLAKALTLAGWDPRGTYVDTYVQRNALVVGFVMGFAVIPVIYTIADDALTTVPNHLRSASLGCGATTWQTTFRIVIPTAMSGLFSALMIGLGRAVGETMIVLMAGGNTPIADWNVFNGFRTLSANIAVELSEAVRNSTHYRTLFLAALTLFVLTFVLNTVAEVVRLRFRKRAYQL